MDYDSTHRFFFHMLNIIFKRINIDKPTRV